MTTYSGNLKIAWALALGVLTSTGCRSGEPTPDAYGNFEAVETTVSAQAQGELLEFGVREGDDVRPGQIVGQIDTVQLALSRAALESRVSATAAQISSVESEVAVLIEEKRVAETDRNRIHRLFESGAATQQQVDDVEGRLAVLERQIEATRSRAATLQSQIEATRSEVAQIHDQIERATVRNPVTGTVLATYAEPHELVRHGSPLYSIADLSQLELRAYVTETQLAEMALGDEVYVAFDGPEGKLTTVPGMLTWISSMAEFTPRTVQTRDERANLVYAFKVRVPNEDRALKIGMPGEVFFGLPEPNPKPDRTSRQDQP